MSDVSDVSTARPNPIRSAALLAAVVVAVVLWLISLTNVDVDNMGETGFLSVLPVTWYVACGLALLACIVGLCAARVQNWLVGSAFTVLLAILYATSAKVEAVPRLPWVYKHLAVTQYIELHGSVDRSIDIYNRWPGFFALAALFGRITGVDDPVSYAAWAEVAFAAIWAVLVFALARSLSLSSHAAWTAALVFTLCDWIGQNYFSPQAFGFTLYLVVCLLALTFLRRAPWRAATAIERALSVITRSRPSEDAVPDDSQPEPGTRSQRRQSERTAVGAIVAIILLQCVITVSHQLTPYLLIAGLIPLLLVGYLRPLWLAAVLVVVPLLYLIPNYHYVEQHFGLFSSYDPVANATYTAPATRAVPSAHWQALGTRVLTAAAYLIALIGIVRRARSGQVRQAVIVGWLCFAPALSLLGQSYGGEGRLRIVLFALPWLSIAASWALWPARLVRTDLVADDHDGARPARSVPGAANRVLVAGVLIVLALVYVPTSLQPERDDRIAAADVRAADWLDARLQPADVVLPAGPNFPAILGPHYNYIVGTTGSLAGNKYHYLGKLNASAVTSIAKLVGKASSQRTYLIFSRNQQRYSDEHGLFEPGEYTSLEQDLASDPTATTVYNEGGTRIFEIPLR